MTQGAQIIEVPCPVCRRPKIAMTGSPAAIAGVLPGPCFECFLAKDDVGVKPKEDK